MNGVIIPMTLLTLLAIMFSLISTGKSPSHQLGKSAIWVTQKYHIHHVSLDGKRTIHCHIPIFHTTYSLPEFHNLKRTILKIYYEVN